MFSKQPSPYSAQSPVWVKCVAKYTATRAESFEVVGGVVVMKSIRLVAACVLSDGESCAVAHLKGDDCSRLEEGQSYYIKNYNLTGRYGQKKLFFCPSTVVFRTSTVDVCSALDTLCRHAVCPPSKPFQETDSVEGYYTVEGDVIRMEIAKNFVEVEVTGVSEKTNTHESIILTAAMEQLVVPADVWAGDIDSLVEELPVKILVVAEGGVVRALRSIVVIVTVTEKMEIAKNFVEVEVMGVSEKTDTHERILLTAAMKQLVASADVWAGDIDSLVEELPVKILVVAEGGVVRAFRKSVHKKDSSLASLEPSLRLCVLRC
ncbi:hypothetical protein MHYP_G00050410 [Metynnis hypsauchen]